MNRLLDWRECRSESIIILTRTAKSAARRPRPGRRGRGVAWDTGLERRQPQVDGVHNQLQLRASVRRPVAAAQQRAPGPGRGATGPAGEPEPSALRNSDEAFGRPGPPGPAGSGDGRGFVTTGAAVERPPDRAAAPRPAARARADARRRPRANSARQVRTAAARSAACPYMHRQHGMACSVTLELLIPRPLRRVSLTRKALNFRYLKCPSPGPPGRRHVDRDFPPPRRPGSGPTSRRQPWQLEATVTAIT
jgi:hypothetical protein